MKLCIQCNEKEAAINRRVCSSCRVLNSRVPCVRCGAMKTRTNKGDTGLCRSCWYTDPRKEAKTYSDVKCVNDDCDKDRLMKSRYCTGCQTLRNHGLTLQDARDLWEAQNNRCKCCKIEGPEVYFVSKFWIIDHDHSCCPGKASSCGKCVRGIVCTFCNASLLTLRMTKEVWEYVGIYLGYV